MASLRQIGIGILLAFISIAIVLGGFSLSTAEGNGTTIVPATETLGVIVPSNVPTFAPNIENYETPTTAATVIFSQTPSFTETPTLVPSLTVTGLPLFTQQPTSSQCSPPAGWVEYFVQPFDTLGSIAQTYKMSQYAIKQGNCLTGDALIVGTRLYVIPLPASTMMATSIPCGFAYGWIDYYVVSGDTLYSIGWKYSVSVAELQRANCLGYSTNIHVGQLLKVPNVATVAPLVTPTMIPTPLPTLTDIPSPTVELPTATSEPPPTDIPTPTPVTPTEVPPPTEPPTPTISSGVGGG